MKNSKLKIKNSKSSSNCGFTLIELVMAMASAMVVILIVGSLLESGHRSWARAFDYANSEAQLDALGTTITFGSMGRKSNKLDYKFYEISGTRFEPVLPPGVPEDIVKGQAVEFRYWEGELNDDVMDVSVTATDYALFYLDGDKLMLDIGPYPPGGIDAVGNKLSGSYVTTVTLAKNVTSLEFSHTTRNLDGDGKGCVRLNMTLAESGNDSETTVTAATLMRNVWP